MAEKIDLIDLDINTDKVITDIQELKMKVAALKTATELALEDGEDFNPADIGNYDDVYDRGLLDAQIENARFILNLFKL